MNDTKENLSRELVIIIEALRVAHGMTFAAVQMLVDEANDNTEEQLDPTNDMPLNEYEDAERRELRQMYESNDDMDGDAESALTSAGFGVDESYEHDTPLGESYGGE